MSVDGLDVSSYQGAINWPQIPDNYQWVAIRALRGLVVDTRFLVNWTGARDRGVRYRLAYAYVTGADPVAQAQALLALVAPLRAGEGVMLDFEDPAVTNAQAQSWLQVVEPVTKRPAVVYLGGPLELKQARLPVVGSRALVWPDYYKTEAAARANLPGYSWDAWQFTDKGIVPGIGTLVDLDRVDNPSAFDAAVGGVPMITYDLAIDNATWTTPEFCAPGTSNLSSAIEDRWPILLNRQGAYGCYNRRPTAGGAKSIHGDGRAIDVGIGWTPTAEQKAALHECTEYLAANAKYLGVQRIIYNRRIWDRNGWRSYNDNAHQDHAHVEQTMEASWTNPLPVAQAFAVISPPPLPKPEPEPPLPEEDDVLLTRYQCSDSDAAFIGWGVLVHEGITVPLSVEWADHETDDAYAQWIQHRQDIHSTDARYWTFVGDLDALNAAETRREWTAGDFRLVVPAA